MHVAAWVQSPVSYSPLALLGVIPKDPNTQKQINEQAKHYSFPAESSVSEQKVIKKKSCTVLHENNQLKCNYFMLTENTHTSIHTYTNTQATEGICGWHQKPLPSPLQGTIYHFRFQPLFPLNFQPLQIFATENRSALGNEDTWSLPEFA